MAGKVYSKAKSLDNNDKISDEQLQDILEQCHKFWFDRHTSGGAMAEGTSNEVPTAEKFAAYQYVLQFFEVGLLQSKEADFISVFPDSVAIVKIPGDDYYDLEPVIACVEIKSRVAYNTINDAEVARPDNGEVIACAYNDAVIRSRRK